MAIVIPTLLGSDQWKEQSQVAIVKIQFLFKVFFANMNKLSV